MITRVEDMTMENFPLEEEYHEAWVRVKALLDAPDRFRLLYVGLPSAPRLHLKHGMANYWKDRTDWVHCSIYAYTEELVRAIEKAQTFEFRPKYEEPQILLLDDLEVVCGKEATQEEIWLLIKRRLEAGKTTIVFSEYQLYQLRLTLTDQLFSLLTLGLTDQAD